jgi:hypothetical protein
VIVLVAWAAAALVALIVVGVLGYELLGHLRRLRREVLAARADLVPAVQRLRGTPLVRLRAMGGRHRAAPPRP